MFWLLGPRAPLARYGSSHFRTHTSRAAKKVAESQQNVPKPGEKPGTPIMPSSQEEISKRSRIAKSLFPKFMRSYAQKINGAPVSHIASFLIVHELSAIVPLFGLWGAFYYFDYIPLGIPQGMIEEGSRFIRRMAERNEWQSLMFAEKGSRVILEGAAAYLVVKAILPVRLIFSLWAMPWFARVFVIPFNARIANLFKRSPKKPTNP